MVPTAGIGRWMARRIYLHELSSGKTLHISSTTARRHVLLWKSSCRLATRTTRHPDHHGRL